MAVSLGPVYFTDENTLGLGKLRSRANSRAETSTVT